MVLLEDAEWAGWSASDIAKKCAVGHSFAAELKRSLCTVHSDTPRTYITKHGTVATMNTANIGKSKSVQPQQQPVITAPVPQITPPIPRVEYVAAPRAVPRFGEKYHPRGFLLKRTPSRARDEITNCDFIPPLELIPCTLSHKTMRKSPPPRRYPTRGGY
jgi:hypothetical protein